MRTIFAIIALTALASQTLSATTDGAAEDFSSLARVFPRDVLSYRTTANLDAAATVRVQSAAKVKAPALEWSFALGRAQRPRPAAKTKWSPATPWPPAPQPAATALAICRPMLKPPASISFWIKNPFGHDLSIQLRAVSSTGMIIGWLPRGIAEARNWTKLTWPAEEAGVIEAPPGSQPMPIQEWRIIVYGKPKQKCRIFLDEFSVQPAAQTTIQVEGIWVRQPLKRDVLRAGGRALVDVWGHQPKSVFEALRVELWGKTGPVAWTAVPPDPRHELCNACVELSIPANLPPGRYTLTVASDVAQITGRKFSTEIEIAPPAPKQTANAGTESGRRQFPSGIIFDSPEIVPESCSAPQVLVPLTCNYDLVGSAPDVVMPDGSTTFAGVDAALNRAIQCHPDARLLVEIYVGATPEWLAAHPSEAMQFKPVQPSVLSGRTRAAPSLASSVWLERAATQLKDLIAHIESSPWADCVAGYLISGGALGNWDWDWWTGTSCLPDYSPTAARAFRAFLRQRYGRLEDFRAAWGQPRKPVVNLLQEAPPDEPRPILSWAEIQIPDLSRRLAHPMSLLEPPAFNDVVDYRIFLTHAASAAAAAMAEAAKSAAGPKPVGVRHAFWPAFNEVGCVLGAPTIDEALSSDAISFIAVDAEPWEMPVSMVHRAGKRIIAGASGRLGSEWAVIQTAARGADAAITSWFPDEKRLKSLSEDLAAPRPAASVAVVVDPESAAAAAAGPEAFNLSGSYQLVTLSYCCVPYEIWSMSEIGDPRLRDRRVIIFANAFRLDEAEREAIDALKSDGRLLVFFYAAGAMRPLRGVNGRDMRSLTGLAIVPIKGGKIFKFRILPGIDPWTSALQEEVEGDTTYKFDPWFCIIDSHAEALGLINDKKRLVAVAARDFGDWKAVYSAPPFVPYDLLAALLRSVGIKASLPPDVPPAKDHPADRQP